MRQAKLRRTELGDVRWFVEWCVNLPIDEFGDSDIDAAEYEGDDFATEAEALAKAKQVYPLDAFGSVRYWRSTFTRYGWDDETASHYEGDES